MANVTTLAKGGTANTGISSRVPQIVTHEMNIASLVSAGLLTTEYAVVLNVPADTAFRLLQVEVVTSLSLGAGARIDVGDSGSATRFVNNASTLTAGTNLTIANATGSGGEVYTAADTIRLTVTGGTLASGILRFVWQQADTSRNAMAVSS